MTYIILKKSEKTEYFTVVLLNFCIYNASRAIHLWCGVPLYLK